ncbi:arylsulfatase [Wocania ichthyoenteri]|uniref:arylsulfatase n=1 Tax=Wocania ichthyoenteri TaxID=1230531 RepID=UPI00068FCDD9|nr:arylsulfatase [Wocania ichthyoenteri]
MTKYYFLSFIILFAFGEISMAQNAISKKPNIIYIMLDDAGYGDFSAFGSKHIKTPNFDKICDEGMKFTQHYSGSAVCAPTRSVLMTGLDTGHTPRRDNTAKSNTKELIEANGRPLVFLEDKHLTVAESLKEAGYKTGGIGKWGLGNPGSSGVPENQGFDYWFGYLDQLHAHNHFSEEIWEDGKMIELLGNINGRKEQYIPYLQENKTLDFIKKNKDEPFFLYLAYTPPHGEYIIPEEDPFFKQYDGLPGGKKVQHYAAMVTRTDYTVGKIMNLLKELEIDENTIVFYTSDNGPNPLFAKNINSGGDLRGIKRSLYEGGIRAAMVVRWPNVIPKGEVSDFIWDMRDFFPTACEIANTKIPNGLSGQSVLKTLKGKNQKEREFNYWEIHSPFQQAVRMGNWKAIRYGTKEPLELYNLEKDMAETTNIAKQNPEIVLKIERYLETARTESPYFPAKEYVKQ